MRPIREAIQKKRAAGSSMGLRLLLYWFTMVLLLMAAILSTLMATGVLSHPAHQLSGTLDIQQRNAYAALDSQMDALTAQSMAMSEKLGKELDAFLAAKGIAFDELNNDPDTIAELEKRLYTPLSNILGAASCSGIFFGLNVTANTSLPNAEDFRAGLYLRYSGLQPTVASEQDVICFRGAAETARSLQLQMHNRWNPELNAALIPGSDQVTAYQGARLADGCLWTKRTELPDTWEQVMLLCVPILDGGGTVRGFCGAEISDLYFSLSHNTVPSAFGNRPLEIVVSDMTCIRCNGRIYEWVLFIATFNNEIIAHSVSAHRGDPKTYYNCLDQLCKRVKNVKEQTAGTVLHTDQGAVYSSRAFSRTHSNYNIIRSMSRAETPTDNPIIESLNGWMKAELILDFGISKVSNLKKTLDQYVLYFNSERFAAALDYKTPIQYRTELGF